MAVGEVRFTNGCVVTLRCLSYRRDTSKYYYCDCSRVFVLLLSFDDVYATDNYMYAVLATLPVWVTSYEVAEKG